jgi:hypothetical protein
MEPLELRKALLSFLGDERFRRFVRQGCRRGKLRYWQEQEWGRFTAARPEFAVGPEVLAAALRLGALPGEGWEKEKRLAIIVAGVAGGLAGGAVHVAIVYGCCLLYVRLHPANGGLFPHFPEFMYVGYALCVTPLSILFGAGLAVRWARPRKSTAGGDIATPSRGSTLVE